MTNNVGLTFSVGDTIPQFTISTPSVPKLLSYSLELDKHFWDTKLRGVDNNFGMEGVLSKTIKIGEIEYHI